MDEGSATASEIVGAKINPITKKPWTEQDREAARQRAKQRVAEGTFGGAAHGRRRKLPAYAVIAAEARRNGRALAASLLEIAQTGSTEKLRMDAIKMLIEIEFKSEANRREEEDHSLKNMSENQLRKLALERITQITGQSFDIELDEDDYEDDDEEDEDGDSAEEED